MPVGSTNSMVQTALLRVARHEASCSLTSASRGAAATARSILSHEAPVGAARPELQATFAVHPVRPVCLIQVRSTDGRIIHQPTDRCIFAPPHAASVLPLALTPVLSNRRKMQAMPVNRWQNRRVSTPRTPPHGVAPTRPQIERWTIADNGCQQWSTRSTRRGGGH